MGADQPVTNFKEYVKKHPIRTAAIISAGVLIGSAAIAATVLTGGAALAIAGGEVFAACSVGVAGAIVGGDAKRSINIGKSLSLIRKGSISSQGMRKQPERSSLPISPSQTPHIQNTNNHNKNTNKHGVGGR